jgi:hypothetical protein
MKGTVCELEEGWFEEETTRNLKPSEVAYGWRSVGKFFYV